MSALGPTSDGPSPKEPPEFSLVLGGPLYRLWRRARLVGDTPKFLSRRVFLFAMLAWAPLLVLSLWERHALSGSVQLPFLYDIEVHVRFLLALPLLIIAEQVIQARIRPGVRQFIDRGLIPDAARAQFDAAIVSASRLRDSITLEVLLIAVVYVVGLGVSWQTRVGLEMESWYGVALDGRLQPSAAGWWLGCISLPLFQFLLLRWYFRLFIWARFLWQVSRIKLNLQPAHPDHCGGLGFLGQVSHTYSPLLLAQGALLSGMIANRIFFAGAKLTDFKFEPAGIIALMILAIIGPLLVFTPQLEAAKRAGLREFGGLAHRYVREFDDKWLRGGAPAGEPLVGSADIQSLADLGNSYAVIKAMRWFPFTPRTLAELALTTLVPVVPLTLTMISLKELVLGLAKLLF